MVAVVGRARRRQVAARLGVHALAPRRTAGSSSRPARVSYGKATSLPARDRPAQGATSRSRTATTPRAIREKVTGKLLTLDRALRADAARAPVRCSTCRSRTRRGRRSTRPSAASARSTRVKRLLLRESQVQPLLLVFEDLHWIDAETQALLDSLVESLPGRAGAAARELPPRVPATAGAARPTTPSSGSTRCPPESAEELLHALLGDDPALEPLKQLLIERTEGNPFFLEESVRTLVETGALAGERGAYRLARGPPTHPGAGHGPGDAGRAHRPAARRRTSACSRPPPSSARTCRSRCSQAIAELAGGRAPPRPRPAPGRRVPLRDQPVPRARVHVQARAHPRGRLRQPAAGAAARAARARSSRPSSSLHADRLRRARRAAGPPRAARRGLGEGRRLSAPGGRQGGGARGQSRGGRRSSSRRWRPLRHLPESQQDARAGDRPAARPPAAAPAAGPARARARSCHRKRKRWRRSSATSSGWPACTRT